MLNRDTLLTKLATLRQRDPKHRLFGAQFHRYELQPVCTEAEVAAFEQRFSITLPADYREFLLTVGNGGVGPYYGLQPLADSLFADLDYKNPEERVDPSLPFPHTTYWNLEYTGDEDDEPAYEVFEEEYYDTRWVTGLLRLSNFGCGVSINLVVNGPEYGHIWVDDRGNENGIYPDPYFGQTETQRTTFGEWYHLWLDQALNECKAK